MKWGDYVRGYKLQFVYLGNVHTEREIVVVDEDTEIDDGTGVVDEDTEIDEDTEVRFVDLTFQVISGDNQPVEGALVTCRDETLITDSLGIVTFYEVDLELGTVSYEIEYDESVDFFDGVVNRLQTTPQIVGVRWQESIDKLIVEPLNTSITVVPRWQESEDTLFMESSSVGFVVSTNWNEEE